MSPGLSDPNWWPTPPPKPPPKVSTSTVVAGGVVLVVVAAGIGFALLGPRSHHSTAPSTPVRSTSAFESCLKNQGVLIPSAETNDAMLRPAAVACRRNVPLLGKSRDPIAAAEAALQQCMQAAQSKLRSSASSIGGVGFPSTGSVSSARSAYQQATAVCRAESFDEPGGGGETSPGAAPTSFA